MKDIVWKDLSGIRRKLYENISEKNLIIAADIENHQALSIYLDSKSEEIIYKALRKRCKKKKKEEKKFYKKLEKEKDSKSTNTEKTEQMLKTDLMLEFIRELSGCYINDFVIRHRWKDIQRGPNLAQYYREVAEKVLEIVEEESKTEKPPEDSKTTEQKSLLKCFNFLCQSNVKTDLITKTNLMVDLLKAISGQVVGTFARDNSIVHNLGDDTQNAEVLLNYYSRVIKDVLKIVES